MNPFDRKWQACVARAREAPRRDDNAPFGFAGRVRAAVMRAPEPAASLEVVWQRLTWRSLAVAGAVLLVSAVVELPHLRDWKPLEPRIENTVAQLVWSL